LFEMGGVGQVCIATRRLVDAAVAAAAGCGSGCSGTIVTDAATAGTSKTSPSPCTLAFDRVCTHALTLLAHDVSDIDMVAPQPERILFNVGMRNVTVIHVTFAL
jgi:hypothetical protein